MKPPIRLIASDLDGTLLRHDGTLSDRNKAALRKAAASGYTIVLASGRPPRTVLPIAAQLGITGLAVCSNGAIVYDLAKQAVVATRPASREALRDLINRLREREPDICFATEHGSRVGYEPQFPRNANWVEDHPPTIADAHSLCAEDVVKLAVHHPELAVEALAELARAVAGEQVSVTFSSRHFIEVAAAGISKAIGLEQVCERLGIAAGEAMAFGDMPNDIAMLSFVGRGIAVANAHPDVLAEGFEVTASNDEDGVAKVIESLIA